MKNDKIFAVLAISIIMLSSMGFVYAHWWDEIFVDGDVYSGVLEMVITDVSQQIYVWYDGEWWPEEHYPEKDIMECDWDHKDAQMVDPYSDDDLNFQHPCREAGLEPPSGYKVIHFYWNDVYPETAVRYIFEVHNIGTIPALWIGATMGDVTITYEDGTTWTGTVDEAYTLNKGIKIVVKADWDRVYTLPLEPGFEPQIHPCEGIDMWVEIYADDYLPEHAKIEWSLDLDYAQYNYQDVKTYLELPLGGGS